MLIELPREVTHRTISFRTDEDMADGIDALARSFGKTSSELIRLSVAETLLYAREKKPATWNQLRLWCGKSSRYE